MAIAMVLGTVIGLAMGLSKSVNAFFNDWVVAILAMPNLAWALFCSLAFGFGDIGPIITVVLTGIPFVIINVREGVRNAPLDLYDMARAFGVTRGHIIRHVLIPSLMPFMFAAGRYAFALGWKGLVVAEVFGGEDGAGWTIKFWYDAHRAHGVIGYALLLRHLRPAVREVHVRPALPLLLPVAARGQRRRRRGGALRRPCPGRLPPQAPCPHANTAAMESLNQVTAGPRSEREHGDATRRHHDG